MKHLDDNGLSYLWGNIETMFVPKTRKINNKALSEDITLTAADVGALPSDAQIQSVQTDYNQNDSTQPDYLKNRPFYTGDPVETEIVNVSLSFTQSGSMYMYQGTDFAGESFEIGQTHTVTIDDAVYDCTAWLLEGLGCLGNSSILGLTIEGSDDVPFLIARNPEMCLVYTTIDGTSHSLKIACSVCEVKEIDKKYIPALDYLNKNNPTGTGSFSINRNADSDIGEKSVSLGYNCIASGDYSHAEGSSTTASGYASHAEGSSTTASGDYSHAEGSSTTASGSYSHAEGRLTNAYEGSSHAEGYQSTASGSSSHAEGYCTRASGKYQHVQGKYNIEDTSNKYAHIVGNGTNITRSNAHTLDWDGNAWFAGTVEGKGIRIVDENGNDITLDALGAQPRRIVSYDSIVANSTWVSDTTYTNYPYRAAVSISSDVTEYHVADVIFSPGDATSGKFAPVCQTYAGGVYIYSKTIPSGSITIPTINVWR